MEGILKVSPEILINTADTFSTEGSQIGTLTTQMMELVTGMSGLWTGEASQAYITKFQGLEDDIQKLIRMVQEHSTDLQTMAQQYQTAEEQNAQLAQSLSADVVV
jgi:WXG100 family type VII secretion target